MVDYFLGGESQVPPRDGTVALIVHGLRLGEGHDLRPFQARDIPTMARIVP